MLKTKLNIEAIKWFLIFSSFLVLFYSSIILNISRSYTNDELFDYTPAVALMNNELIFPSQGVVVFGLKVPLVDGPYQGALKTWITTPLIYLFGTSYYSLRTINVVIAILYLFAFYWALRGLLKKKYAMLVFLIPFLDSNFLLTAPLDYGSFLFQTISIVLGFGCIFRLVILKNIRYFWLFSLLIGCLLAKQLTSIPIVLSMPIFTFLFASPIFCKFLKDNGRISFTINILLIPFLFFLLPLIPHSIYFCISDGFSSFLEITRSTNNAAFFNKIISNIVNLSQFSNGNFIYSVYGLYFISFLVFIISYKHRSNLKTFFLGFLIFSIFSLLVYSSFNSNTRPWHYQVLYPFSWCLAFISFAYINDFLLKGKVIYRILLCLLYIVLGAGLILSSLHSFYLLGTIERNKGEGMDSLLLNDFSSLLNKHNFTKMYSVNYSLGWPLYTMSEGEIKLVVDLAFSEIDDNKIEGIIADLLSNNESCLVYRHCAYAYGYPNWKKFLNKELVVCKIIEAINMNGNRLKVDTISNNNVKFVLVYANQ